MRGIEMAGRGDHSNTARGNFSIKPGKDDFFENCHFQNPVQMTDSHFHSFVYPELLRSYSPSW